MYLHNDNKAFKILIEQAAESSGVTLVVVEKDYYVTLILKLLAKQFKQCVFKGSTSLLKGFRIINRFSENIDITLDEHIGESRRKRLKNVILKGISEELGMPIVNWAEMQCARDYNAYLFSYESVFDLPTNRLPRYIRLNTALSSYSLPTQTAEIRNYIGDYLENRGRSDLTELFSLGRFPMKLQSLEWTYIDKIFALCDYYLQGKSKHCSRHLYDIYKLTPLINFNTAFAMQVRGVKEHRSRMPIFPSAQDGIDVPAVILEFCDSSFYKEDYQAFTGCFVADPVPYDNVIRHIRVLAASNLFAT